MKLSEIKLTYQEHEAMHVIRKLLHRQPDAANLIMRGMAKEVAVNVLLQAQRELADLLKVSQAISAAAGEITKLEKNNAETA
jgi:predicted DNA-binding protein (UPF0251 family)